MAFMSGNTERDMCMCIPVSPYPHERSPSRDEGNCWISYDPERECFVFGDPDYYEEPLDEVILRDGKLVAADE